MEETISRFNKAPAKQQVLASKLEEFKENNSIVSSRFNLDQLLNHRKSDRICCGQCLMIATQDGCAKYTTPTIYQLINQRSRCTIVLLVATIIIHLNGSHLCSASHPTLGEDDELSKTMDLGSKEEVNLSSLVGEAPIELYPFDHNVDKQNQNRDRIDGGDTNLAVSSSEVEFASQAEPSDRIEQHQYISILNNQSNIVLSDSNVDRAHFKPKGPANEQPTTASSMQPVGSRAGGLPMNQPLARPTMDPHVSENEHLELVSRGASDESASKEKSFDQSLEMSSSNATFSSNISPGSRLVQLNKQHNKNNWNSEPRSGSIRNNVSGQPHSQDWHQNSAETRDAKIKHIRHYGRKSRKLKTKNATESIDQVVKDNQLLTSQFLSKVSAEEEKNNKMISYSAMRNHNQSAEPNSVQSDGERTQIATPMPSSAENQQLRAAFGHYLATREQRNNESQATGSNELASKIPKIDLVQANQHQDLVSQNSQLDLASTKGPFELTQGSSTRQPTAEPLATASSSQSSNELETTLKQHQREPIVDDAGSRGESSGTEGQNGVHGQSGGSDSGDDDYSGSGDLDSDSDANDSGGSNRQLNKPVTGRVSGESGKSGTITAKVNGTTNAKGSAGKQEANLRVKVQPQDHAPRTELLVGPFRSEAEAPTTITLSGIVYQKSGSTTTHIRPVVRPQADNLGLATGNRDNLVVSSSSAINQADAGESKQQQQQVILATTAGMDPTKQQQLFWHAGNKQLQPNSRLVGLRRPELASSYASFSANQQDSTGKIAESESLDDSYTIGGGLRLSPFPLGSMSLLSGLAAAAAAAAANELSQLEPPKQILAASATNPLPLTDNGKQRDPSQPQMSFITTAASLDQAPIWAKKNQDGPYYLSQAPSGNGIESASPSQLSSSSANREHQLEAAQSQVSKHKSKHKHPIVIVQKDVKPVKYHLLRAYLKLRRLLHPFEATYIFPNDPHAGLFRRTSAASLFGPAQAPPSEAVAH